MLNFRDDMLSPICLASLCINSKTINTSFTFFLCRLNEFDNKFFGITDAETNNMDPQHKLLLQCTYRALEDAGIPMEKASGTRTGVFLGNILNN